MTSTLRVGIIGAAGKMGTAACGAVGAAPDLDLVATVNKGESLDVLRDKGVQVAIELTEPAASPGNVAYCVDAGIHAVVGTTGWDDTRLDALRAQLASRPEVGVLIAPNFALGAVLAMQFARMAAPYFESCEIVELHHPDKVDAPSGTARHTAHGIAQARRERDCAPMPDATTTGDRASRGAVVDGVHVHAVRLRGLVAHEEILFGNVGEQFTIRHDSFDRVSFMGGVLLGVRQMPTRPGLTVGLEHLMNLTLG